MHYERAGNRLVFHRSRTGSVIVSIIFIIIIIGVPLLVPMIFFRGNLHL